MATVFLTPHDVRVRAEERKLYLHENTIRREADRGFIPCLRTPSGFRLFTIEDVDKFIEERRGKKRRRSDLNKLKDNEDSEKIIYSVRI
jgi:hypothetical protein